MVRRLFIISSVLAGSLAQAHAWTPPAVGQACKGMRGDGPRVTAIAGNFLGGKPIRDGIVSRVSFQGCFASLDHCETWLAGKARAYPVQPGIATCRSVVLR